MLEELGVEPIINCAGTLTVLGGTVLDDEVLDAMSEAAKVYLDMVELHEKAGEYVARLVGAEAAYISAGAGAGLVLSVAACMTRGDTLKMQNLPDTTGCRKEVIVQKPQRNMYDYLIRIPGAKIKLIGDDDGVSRRHLEDAINDDTAAVVYFMFDPQQKILSLEEIISVSHSYDVPVIVDAAAELPPKENVKRLVQTGADLIIFSGGKDIGAPNDTGLILGKSELIKICRRLGPHSYEVFDSRTNIYIGRPMKISKEDVLGFVAAFKKYMASDERVKLERYETILDNLLQKLSHSAHLRAKKIYPGLGHPRPVIIPRAEIEVRDKRMTAYDLMLRLRSGKPRIFTYVVDDKLYINPQCMNDDEVDVVVKRILEEIEAKS